MLVRRRTLGVAQRQRSGRHTEGLTQVLGGELAVEVKFGSQVLQRRQRLRARPVARGARRRRPARPRPAPRPGHLRLHPRHGRRPGPRGRDAVPAGARARRRARAAPGRPRHGLGGVRRGARQPRFRGPRRDPGDRLRGVDHGDGGPRRQQGAQ